MREINDCIHSINAIGKEEERKMKLKKILAATLVGAMVLTNVPVGNHGTAVAVAAENQEVTTGYELKRIDQEILRRNAKSNSENKNPASGVKGGPAAWAFDDLEHWWHSDFNTGHPTTNHRINIETGFDGEIKHIKKLTYTPRTDDKGGIIKDYEIRVSTEVNPTEEQWTTIKSGTFRNTMDKQEVVLQTAVEATRIRLVATSNYSKSGFGDYATAKKIEVFEEVPVQVEGVTLSQSTADLKIGGTVTLTATVTPDNASQEVEWSSSAEEIAAVDENGMVTAYKAGTAVITATSKMDSSKTATCTVVVTRDDTALDAAIKEAEAKMNEKDFDLKYTGASIEVFATALDAAYAAKADSTMIPGEVKLVVDELTRAIAGLEMKAVITIHNNGTDETLYREVGEQVKVVAKQAPEGQKFSHWTVDGKAICYNPSYTFTVYKDTVVESVYIPVGETVKKEVSVLCDVSYKDGKVKFLSKYSVPADAGYTVLRTGVVATDSKGYEAIQAQEEELTLETTATTRLKKYGVDTNYYLANFTQYLKTSRATTWYARGYVTYQDSEGTHTVYSDIAEYTIQ